MQSKWKKSESKENKTEDKITEHTLLRNEGLVDEAVALGTMEKEIRLAKRENRPLDLDAAANCFSTDFGKGRHALNDIACAVTKGTQATLSACIHQNNHQK